MHHHSSAVETPWLIVLLLLACVVVSLARLISRKSGQESDVAHLLMNVAMLGMALDTALTYGAEWLLLSAAITTGFGIRLGWQVTHGQGPLTPGAVHFVGAVVMTFAVAAMLTGATGDGLAFVLAGVIVAELLATFVLLAGGRPAAFVIEDGVVSISEMRVATIPHLGMGIGMVAMLVGM
jgi:hypothetical protein